MKSIYDIIRSTKPLAIAAALLFAAACARGGDTDTRAGTPIVIGNPTPMDGEQDQSYLPMVGGSVALFAAKHTGTPVWNSPSLLMNNITGTVTATGGISYSPTKYYDITADNFLYDFLAIHPGTADKGISITPASAAKGPAATIELLDTSSGTPVPHHQDVMYAAASDIEKGITGVPLHFRHLLSQIVVRISKDATQVPQKVFLHDVHIEGLSRAEFDLATGQLSHYGGHMDVSILQTASRDYEVTEEPKEVCREMMLPMEGSVERSYYLKYTINEDFGAVRIPQPGDDSQIPAIPHQNWLPGYTYTYDLKVVDAGIIVVIDAGIDRDKWVDEDLPPITIF